MRLSEHFTLAEAITSQEAARRGIDNNPDEAMLTELVRTAGFMEGVRDALNGRPILVSSWYRCEALERALKPDLRALGHHCRGAAVDFICPGFGTPLEVARRLAGLVDELRIGQLILEYGRWVHISRLPVARPGVNRVLTIDTTGTRTGLLA